MSPKISKEVLSSFKSLAEKVDMAVIAVSDTDPYVIVFASKTAKFLGYQPRQLRGQNFEIILPERVKAINPETGKSIHHSWMESFKSRDEVHTSREMNGGIPVKGVNKQGLEVDILVDISFFESTKEGEPGLFLAFIQNPKKVLVPAPQLSDLKVRFQDLFSNPRKAAQWVTAKLVAGALALSTFVTQVTPLGGIIGTVFKATKGALELKQDRPNVDVDNVEINELISFEQLKVNLSDIRQKYFVTRRIKGAIALAYYKWDARSYEFRYEPQLVYWTDSNAVFGGRTDTEIWYFDINTEEDEREKDSPLVLQDWERKKLQNLDCFWKNKVAKIRIGGEVTSINGVVCPTWVINVENNLKFSVSANVSILAVNPSIAQTEENLSRLSKFSFSVSPSLESGVFKR